ncbi:MAG: hypothetical protein IPK15_25235 [Verrucomicrobia bacterium]|nr:hypothetical protein [Verrucomicrobiota bacterium]
MRTYENGVLQNTFTAPGAMSAINDVNAWLGRSQYDDLNMQGEFDEFRIYDRVLTAREVAGNFGAGPEVVNLSEDPVSFVSQPNSVTNYESFRADFEAVATGAAPLTYQWYRDDVAIPGATGPSYSFVTSVADSGAHLQRGCKHAEWCSDGRNQRGGDVDGPGRSRTDIEEPIHIQRGGWTYRGHGRGGRERRRSGGQRFLCGWQAHARRQFGIRQSAE